MAKKGITTIEQYLAAQPEASRSVLRRVRSVIVAAIPKAEEVISYGIPGYRVGNKVVLWFAGWKAHFSLYPVTSGTLKVLGDEIASFKVVKSTIRFPLSQPIPEKLITRIAKLRATEVRGKAARP